MGLRTRVIVISFLFGFIVQGGICEEKVYNAGVDSKAIMRCSKNVLGQDITYPSIKTPEVTCLNVTIHPGQQTGWHTHSVPGYAYVISGKMKIEYKNSQSREFKAGDAFCEVVDTPHNGINEGADDVVLVAFFMGEQGVDFTKKLKGVHF